MIESQAMLSVRLAKLLMKAFPRYASPDAPDSSDIFRHESYKLAPSEKQAAIQLMSSQFRYDFESNGLSYFEHYFPSLNRAEFRGKCVLDVGSFTGGRLVQWMERYGFREGHGIDVTPVYAEAGNRFAALKRVNAVFVHGYGESLPYQSDYFDLFEHVRDVAQVVSEAWRVLKPGGKMLAVFPPFYNPLESHLGLTTGIPALHLFFPGKTIASAYHEVVAERGREGAWYQIPPQLESWEKSPSLNGITVSKFRKIINSGKWKTIDWRVNSFLSDGRRAQKPLFRALNHLLTIPAHLALCEEIFLGRICCVLEKVSFQRTDT
jgi:SAM-dependent methyltransferase